MRKEKFLIYFFRFLSHFEITAQTPVVSCHKRTYIAHNPSLKCQMFFVYVFFLLRTFASALFQNQLFFFSLSYFTTVSNRFILLNRKNERENGCSWLVNRLFYEYFSAKQ